MRYLLDVKTLTKQSRNRKDAHQSAGTEKRCFHGIITRLNRTECEPRLFATALNIILPRRIIVLRAGEVIAIIPAQGSETISQLVRHHSENKF